MKKIYWLFGMILVVALLSGCIFTTIPDITLPTYQTFSSTTTTSGTTTSNTTTTITTSATTITTLYTLSFESLGGSVISPVLLGAGSTINVTTNNYIPTKTGSVFIGWYLDPGFQTSVTLLTMPAANQTLYALWDQTIPTDLVFAWGLNEMGQIGNDRALGAVQPIPDKISSFFGLYPDETIVMASLGENHTTVLSSSGRVFSFGWNYNAALGLSTTQYNLSTTPIDITSRFALELNEQIIFISSGDYHNMALTSDKRLFAWGDNKYGQLALDPQAQPSVSLPELVDTQSFLSSTESIVTIACGGEHTLFLTDADRILSVGHNNYGQLGVDPTTVMNHIPYDLTYIYPVFSESGMIISIVAGESHSLMLAGNGNVFAWGRNHKGQLGNGNQVDNHIPEAVNLPGLDSSNQVIKIAAGGNHNFALTVEGDLIGWGNNESGQLGNETYINQLDPVFLNTCIDMASGDLIEIIAAGKEHSVFLTSGYQVYTVGDNDNGQLGDDLGFNQLNDWKNITSYFQLPDGEVVTNIFAGGWHTLALSDRLYCIEFDSLGGTSVPDIAELEGTPIAEPSPNPILDGYEFNGWYTDSNCQTPYVFTTMPNQDMTLYACWLPIPTSGDIYAWGSNNYGELGDNTTNSQVASPLEVTLFTLNPGETIVDIVAGISHNIALTSAYRVFSWGWNQYGQLGNNTTNNSSVPIDITQWFNLTYGEHIEKIFAGHMHSFAISSTGNIYAWGNNTSYQLGDNTNTNKYIPTLITANFGLLMGEEITEIAAGLNHSIALTSEGRVFAWGSGSQGQIGNGNTSIQMLPIDITANFVLGSGETITNIFSGLGHNIALSSAGNIFGWGKNDDGQIGIGTITNVLSPISITNQFPLAGGVTIIQIAAGWCHNHALLSDGNIVSWGRNAFGELGIDSASDFSTTPMSMLAKFNLHTSETIVKIYADGYHGFAITSEYRVFAWGGNSPTLGDNTNTNRLMPIEITSFFSLITGEVIDQLYTGSGHTFAITDILS